MTATVSIYFRPCNIGARYLLELDFWLLIYMTDHLKFEKSFSKWPGASITLNFSKCPNKCYT